jgi:diacylglycerol O-acyltransferase
VVRADLGELKAVGHLLGGSVNDVILAACTAGLRTLFLSRSEEPPSEGLRAMVPMNIRESSEQLALGNRVSSLFVNLPVAETDPQSRLRQIIDHTTALKSSGAGLGAATMIDLASLAPPLVHASVARSLYATRLFNLTITNVPGPRVALYAFGAQLVEVLPVVPLAAEHAIGIAIVSYDGSIAVGISADRDSTHDLDVLADGIEQGFAELCGLLQAEPQAVFSRTGSVFS